MSGITEKLRVAIADRYVIERELGHGGMATVYLAHDVRHDRKVALKVLRPELAAVIGAERFLTEIKTTANLQHPHILPLHDSGEADSFLFYVMPYVEGESLRDLISREKQLPVDDAVRIASDVAAALDYAHRQGVIHRDIKPENILLHDGSALVADFGIALAASRAGEARLTETGMSLGTPHYMSPEQATGERDLTPKCDVYALGCVLYEMLLGEPPFTGPTAQSIIAQVVADKPAPLIPRRERIPPHLEDAVLTAIEKLPADRFRSATAFAEALQPAAHADRRGIRTARPAPSVASRLALAVPVAVAALAFGLLLGPHLTTNEAAPTAWRGELLGGPRVAYNPRVSPDGQLVAFAAMVDGQTQLGVLRPETGEWKVLTQDRAQGEAEFFSWSADNSRIFYSRFFEVPKGIYSISPLGTGHRLVLADATNPDVLPDGSLLVSRLNGDGRLQMYRFWPREGRMDTLPAITDDLLTSNAFFRAFPDGREAVFFGRWAGEPQAPPGLYAVELSTKEVRRLAPSVEIPPTSLAVSPDGESVIVDIPVGNADRLVAVSRDGSNRLRELAVLTGGVRGFDMDGDGILYFDQMLTPTSLRRYDPVDKREEAWPIPALDEYASILPLPDDRVLLVVRTSGGRRVVVSTPGRDQQPFMAAEYPTHGPMAMLGRARVALMLGADTGAVVAIVSVETGQLESRLPGIHPTALAGTPDGQTLYYVEAGVVWAIPTDGGTPRRVRDGNAVAVDPAGQYVVVEVIDENTVRLFRVPLDGNPEGEIALRGDLRLAPGLMAANAVGPDGRIAVSVVSTTSWYWPTALVDPRTGAMQIVPPGLDYDMFGGWDGQGRVVYYAQELESSLWRFRPASTEGRRP